MFLNVTALIPPEDTPRHDSPCEINPRALIVSERLRSFPTHAFSYSACAVFVEETAHSRLSDYASAKRAMNETNISQTKNFYFRFIFDLKQERK